MAYTVTPSLAGTWRVVRTRDGATVSGDFINPEQADLFARIMNERKEA